MRQRKAYVYIFKLANSSIYKIGRSANPTYRIKRLQTGSSQKIFPVFCGLSLHSMATEANLHKRFKDSKLQGEWFNLTDIEVKNIIAFLRSVDQDSKEELRKREDNIEKKKNLSVPKRTHIQSNLLHLYPNQELLPLDINNDQSDYEWSVFQDVINKTRVSPRGKDIIYLMWGIKPGRYYSKALARRNMYADRLDQFNDQASVI